MSFPRYPEYRDSGVEWLAEVPAHWNVLPIKNNFKVVGGSTPASEQSGFWDGDIVWVTPADLSKLDSFQIKSSMRKITPAGLKSCGTLLVPSGSVVLSTRAPIGSLGVAATALCTNQGCKALVPQKGIHGLYFAYILSITTAELNNRGRGSTFLELSGDELSAFKVPSPNPIEQRAITIFLDHETAKIDALIQEQQRLIALLKEKRQAVISHAVTKGLDPTVPMKDSGVEWLGEVPAHWEIGPIKFYVEFLDGRRIPLSSEERGLRQGDYPYYGASGVIDRIDGYIFDEDLVLVSEDGANLLARSSRVAFVARGKYWVNNHAHILRPVDANLVFWAEVIEHQKLDLYVTGSAQPKLTSEALSSMIVATPPSSEERRCIEQHILEKTVETDNMYQGAQESVRLLNERRSALISAAVTGKIDVRNWQPPADESAFDEEGRQAGLEVAS
ncbi:restriction endonuclease subunit S [Kineobactrum sediminis]|uniref:Restriction endonuclease subunit S n=1 Tax=Kineobactrum sediminis TaxID=1905677 RepID=A0A2N5XYU0_9GAMM|nr:restriction endonuclease subunit S [Kineobactrum sediminis]PLW81303.1 restriction endonuclease subunit S [Kineobactrum sediminis]